MSLVIKHIALQGDKKKKKKKTDKKKTMLRDNKYLITTMMIEMDCPDCWELEWV